MLPRVLEPEVMDSASDAVDYDAMDHSVVNERFVADFLATEPQLENVLDLATGTALIPIELCRVAPAARITAVDAASHMLQLARKRVNDAGFARAIELAQVDAKQLPYSADSFSAVISNSLVHHVPEPIAVLREASRVCQPGGRLFFRDLLRPHDQALLDQLVNTYAANDNAHQRQLFSDSLHAALTLDEIRALVASLGFAAETVQVTSDRHWTWSAVKAD